ncbi:retrovirus-related pol polyprotein from transposon TNT 1-94 [Tanacetum coccineum]
MEAELIEKENLARKKKEEANIALIESWDTTQAMMEADFELAQRLQTEEQGEITIEERSRLFVELMNKRKKHFAMLRAEEKRRKPPTKAQKRNQMSTYLKNMVKSKEGTEESSKGTKDELNSDKSKKAESSEEKAKGSRNKMLGKKRAGKEQQKESSKRQRMEDDKETDEHEEVEVDDEAELKKHLVIVKDDDIAIDAIPLATKQPVIVEYKLLKEGIMVHYQLIRADGTSKRYSLMIRMLRCIDREDLQTLWKLIKTKHGDIRPEDEHERVLWGDLKVMLKPDIRNIKHSVLNANSDVMCATCKRCLFDASHDNCVLEFVNCVTKHTKSKTARMKKQQNLWKPTGKKFTEIGLKWRLTGRTFTLVDMCPLTRLTPTQVVPLREPTPKTVELEKPELKVYSRKPKLVKPVGPKSKPEIIYSRYLDSGCSKHMIGDRSQLTNFVSKFLGTVKFGNDQIAKIMGYGNYQMRNVTISRVYYVEGLGHNLFSVRQFCDSDLKVAFRKYTCFVRNLKGVDLLSGSQRTYLYTLSMGDLSTSFPICLLLKASKTKSWLWHRRLSHLNFGAMNHLARQGLVRGLPKLKFEKDHLCSACSMGKGKKQTLKPKSEDTNQ